MTDATSETSIDRLLERVLDLRPEERDPYLQQIGATDPILRERLEKLLASATHADGMPDCSPLRTEAPAIGESSTQVIGELSPGERLGAYRIVGLIGRGGMGAVYRATRADGLFEKDVAIKVLKSDAVEHLGRFESERRILAGLDHPGIARLLDGGVTRDGRPYMLMDLVPGASITDYCRAHRSSLEQRLDLIRQCAEALVFAHAQGVIHRDLKPSNILVTAQARVKLLDFGVAKLLHAKPGAALTTVAAPLTPAYAAPEQLQGRRVSAATDIYALGIVLYELLTGRAPSHDPASLPPAVLLHRVLNLVLKPASLAAREQPESPLPAGLLTGALDAIVARCLCKDPADRYAPATDLLADLARYQRGEALAAHSPAVDHPLVRRDTAEHRQLSVLFCDLVDSTSLAEELDAEAFHDCLLAYQNAAADVVGRYEGHVAQRQGDGLLAYFGYPAAHDDDAERAVRCGYEIVAALTRLPCKPSLAVRVGIHTGTVVIGHLGGIEQTQATGAAIHLAARLQALAEPNTVLISDTTFKLVPGLFITRDLGTPAIKGFTRPVRVYQVMLPSGVRSRLEAADRLTPFVGREQELALLSECWHQVQEGRGQAILLSAEPGLGKSRLLLMLRSRLADTPHTWLECRALHMTRNSPYRPVVELLHRGLALRESDTPEQKLQRLEHGLGAVGLDQTETVPLLAPLLELKLSERYTPIVLGPELRRQRTLEALSAWAYTLARQQPLVIAFEDLHWADASTLDWLGLLLEQLAAVPVLLVMTSRPEFVPPWPARSHLATASLHPLPATQAGEMLSSLARGPLPTSVQKMLLERAGGVPLFVEELTKTLLESGQLVEREGRLELDGGIERLSIPQTLQGSLMARLDRLGPARELIQTAAVIGREIPYRLLHLVSDLDEFTLRQQLQQLTDAELLYRRGSPPESAYVFKHALIQDAARDALLKSTRQRLHGVIAGTLEQHFKERAQAEPEVLAEHFEKAREFERAVQYFRLAADKAEARTASTEATHYARQALRLLHLLPAGDARDRIELPLLLILAWGLASLRNYSHAEVRPMLDRAEALLSDTQHPFAYRRTLSLLWMCTQHAGQFEPAVRVGRRMVNLEGPLYEPLFESLGHAFIGASLVSLGRFAEAEQAFAQALRKPDLAGSRKIAWRSGIDPITTALLGASHTRWFLGYPDQALTQARAAWAQAQAVGMPHTSCMAESVGADVYLFRREPEPLCETGPATIELCEKYGNAHHRLITIKALGVALCVAGRPDEGLDLIRQAIQAMKAAGEAVYLPESLCFLAEHCAASGRLAEAQAALDEAFALVERQDNRRWEAELHRIKGELLLAANAEDTTAAEACFHKALEVARGQSARSLELRAAISLARLWQRQDRSHEARALLKPVYDWFTEGFDTADLREARSLLDTLAQSGA